MTTKQMLAVAFVAVVIGVVGALGYAAWKHDGEVAGGAVGLGIIVIPTIVAVNRELE